MADEVGVSDTKVMGVFGAMHRGATKEEALVSVSTMTH